MEVEKCAVVRTLVKQKGHLQKMIARQERELEAIKQTQVRVKLGVKIISAAPKKQCLSINPSAFSRCTEKFHFLL